MLRCCSCWLVIAGCWGSLLLSGCSSVREETIQVIKVDPLNTAKAMLQQYVEGQPLASEVTTYASLVGEVRKAHPAQADILEKGLAELQAAPTEQRSALAQKILNDLK